MCSWAEDPQTKKLVKLEDCLMCDCSTSSWSGQHNYYHGVCVRCGQSK